MKPLLLLAAAALSVGGFAAGAQGQPTVEAPRTPLRAIAGQTPPPPTPLRAIAGQAPPPPTPLRAIAGQTPPPTPLRAIAGQTPPPPTPLRAIAGQAPPPPTPLRAPAGQTPPPPTPLRAIAGQVSEARLRSTVERLVGFGTRHTLSARDHPTRGIGAALNWTQAEFETISRGCGGCLQIVRTGDIVTGRRIPNPTLVENVVAIQRGTSDPDRVIIITGHIDSRVTDPMNATADAPGANDDGSGTAAVIEAARVLSRHRFAGTIVYAALSGEEQGLIGGRILADYARAQGWRVEANLNNDIIGNSCGSDGVCDDAHVRVFSEGLRWQGGDALRPLVRSQGGENDSPSRNLSRFLDTLADQLSIGLGVRPIWRNDRFGRGGDHTEFLNAGFPAVRFSVAVENYNWQHQDLRTESWICPHCPAGRTTGTTVYGDTIDHMDFPYLRRVTQLNVAALAALARAPMPPEPTVEGAVSPHTTVRWRPVSNAVGYFVRWRRTDSSQWERTLVEPDRDLRLGVACRANASPQPPEADGYVTVHGTSPTPPSECVAVLPGIRVDDWVFGVSSVAADGSESPVASAVPGGAFRPYVPPPPAPNP